MRILGWSLVGLLCWGAIAPHGAVAQEEDRFDDIIDALLSPNWRLSVHGGLTRHGRFLLQRPHDAALDRERALTSEGGYAVGISAGKDLLSRIGLRLSYTYADADLAYRENSGDGSEVLDLDDVGGIASHVGSIELVTNMVRGPVAPYASGGLIGVWWVLDEESAFLAPTEGGTEFRTGAIAALGLAVRLTDRIDTKFEVTTLSARNPFTGRESFRALGGTTIDEPTRVGRMDFRVGLGYRFGSSPPPGVPVQ